MQFVLLVCQMLSMSGRAENRGKKVSFREKFDVAVARAVAEMRILGGSKKCREVTPIDGRISLATGPSRKLRIGLPYWSYWDEYRLLDIAVLYCCRTPMLQLHRRRNKGSNLQDFLYL
ncbi:PREDICTED: uncharacterized protein LOC105128598 isoform X3 [Populus euphratica]|uniref:Uncharacterized protein LOC105128598 isoform X3 n=1 Tax=Populus euphratica TaxID=75702 RepID=A0AAJ6XRS7_POPEU|nr:PREDICTED: uncharacterized protein LOC105128598 isoform X3 [Populus euphratica]